MRVLLVHSAPLSRLGGAEISLREHLKSAPAGVEVEVCLPDEPVQLDRFDVVVLANLRPVAKPSNGSTDNLKRWIWNRINQSALQRFALRSEVESGELWCRRLKGYKGYVIKSERDIHPCVRRDARCIDAATMERTPCGDTRMVARVFERLYNLCDAVQFLSPLHRRVINKMVNIDVRQYEIASPIDLDHFRDFTPVSQRKNAALLFADAIRSSDSAERRAHEAGFPVEQLDYLSVPYEQMPALLNQYRAVVMDPVMLHAFGRLAAESLACGCRLLASERVGAISWPDPLDACRQANRLFWAMISNKPERPNPRRLRASGGGLVNIWS